VKVQSRSRVTPWLFVAPAALLIAVLIIYPTFWTVRLSLYGGQGFNFTNFVGLQNFVRLLTDDPNFLDLSQFPPRGAVVNNVLWLVTYTPLVLGIGLIIAVLADRVRYESYIKSVIFLPMAISATAAGVIWLFVYSPSPSIGLLNAVLTALIPGFQPIAWTGSVDLINPAIIAAAIWINAGFVMVILSAALKSIPAEILEAARVDGANGLQIFARIQVPLLGPTISVVAVTMIIYVIKMFDLIYVMGGQNGGPLGAARVIAFTQYVETFNSGRAGYGSAVAVIMLIVVIPIMLLNLRRFRAEAGR
jgi:alpha-glucoside transport system permease protein